MQLLLPFAERCSGPWVTDVASATLRCRVLAVIEQSPTQLTGKEIAQATGTSYRQTIDALNALYNAGKIERIGRKATARWRRLQPQDNPLALLEAVFFRKFTRA
jgi:predicted Rossmann fold nucleotide-binding protein DprA/Smf involved in DNA uptake